MSLHAANMVGAALTLLLVGWIAYQFVPQRSAVLAQIDFPTKLLPYLGPVLMILIPVKLFRPKHVGDFWAMQGIGMLAVALGCAMANDVIFGVMLTIYLCSFVWSMSLFYLYREVRPEKSSRSGSARSSGRGLLLLGQSGRWSAVIVAAGLVLFLILPRPNDKRWELPLRVKGKIETGAPEGNMDLNRTGAVEPNKDVAFEVHAQDINQLRPFSISISQSACWRLRSLSHYENGKWTDSRTSGPCSIFPTSPRPRTAALPAPGDLFGAATARICLISEASLAISCRLFDPSEHRPAKMSWPTRSSVATRRPARRYFRLARSPRRCNSEETAILRWISLFDGRPPRLLPGFTLPRWIPTQTWGHPCISRRSSAIRQPRNSIRNKLIQMDQQILKRIQEVDLDRRRAIWSSRAGFPGPLSTEPRSRDEFCPCPSTTKPLPAASEELSRQFRRFCLQLASHGKKDSKIDPVEDYPVQYEIGSLPSVRLGNCLDASLPGRALRECSGI